MRYHPHTPADVQMMLAAAGAESIDALFSSIPDDLKLARPLALPPPLDERALLDHLNELAHRDTYKTVPFLGAGAYPHHLPPAVDQLLLRSEFYTAYTPYQPELSQGTLQAIFEFQTLVALLTGLEVANASMYDGASGAAEAALMTVRVAKGDKRKVVVGRALHPEYRKVIRTYLSRAGVPVVEVPYDPRSGTTDLDQLRAAIGSDVAGVILGYPNYFGRPEPLAEAARLCHATGADLVSCTTEALAFGLLPAPGELGADIAVGEMQCFGNAMSFGGPGLGFFACRESQLRQMPGRLCGATVDKAGRRGFVLTLSTREQHIRRERATSNICTNHGLCALGAAIHLALLGKTGLRELALLNYRKARYARESLAVRGLEARFPGGVFNEFVTRVGDAPGALARARERGVVAGHPLGGDYPELADCILSCVTEVHSKGAIDAMVELLAPSTRAQLRSLP